MIDLKLEILEYMGFPPFPMTAGEFFNHFSDVDTDTLLDAMEDLIEFKYVEEVGTKKKPVYIITDLGINEVVRNMDMVDI